MFDDTQLDTSERDRLRLAIGDTDNYDLVLSDAIYDFAIVQNTDSSGTYNQHRCIIELLRYIVSKLAHYSDEVTNELENKYEQRYKHFVELLDKYLNDPSFANSGFKGGYTGGLYVADVDANRANSAVVHNPLTKNITFV